METALDHHDALESYSYVEEDIEKLWEAHEERREPNQSPKDVEAAATTTAMTPAARLPIGTSEAEMQAKAAYLARLDADKAADEAWLYAMKREAAAKVKATATAMFQAAPIEADNATEEARIETKNREAAVAIIGAGLFGAIAGDVFLGELGENLLCS